MVAGLEDLLVNNRTAIRIPERASRAALSPTQRAARAAAALLAALVLAGCVHSAHRSAEAKSYHDAQAKAIAERPPLFELRAQPGQTIELKGVEALVVHDPREQKVAPLPVAPSPVYGLVKGLVDTGARIYGVKVAADAAVDIIGTVADRAGDHSVTTNTTSIEDSYNDQSDHSTHGDTITDSSVIGGDVAGDGAGIGSSATDLAASDGSVIGDDVVNVGGDQTGGDHIENSGRFNSPGPIDNSDNSDNSTNPEDPGDGDAGDAGEECPLGICFGPGG